MGAGENENRPRGPEGGVKLVSYLTKEQERFILLKRVFRNPYPGDESSLVLFELCRELKLNYCTSFKDNGYDIGYAKFESDKVIGEVADNIDDRTLVKLFEKNRQQLSEYHDFYGQHYTYRGKNRSLQLSSSWTEIKKEIHSIFMRYPSSCKVVLNAIYEVNFEKNRTWKDYYEVFKL